MEKINIYISEKLKINKNTSIQKYHPNNRQELIDIVDELLKERGNNANLNDIDVSKITDFSRLFYNMPKIENIKIDKWDVSNGTCFDEMFAGDYNFNSDISSWNMSSAESCSSMFSQCLHFNQKLESWKIKDDAKIYFMFSGCNDLKERPSWYKNHKFRG